METKRISGIKNHEVLEMTSEKAEEKIKLIIGKVAKLGWLQTLNGDPYMHLADVEKSIIALFDPDYMLQIDRWIGDAEKTDTVVKKSPELKHRDYEMNKRSLDSQAKVLGMMIRGEACIFKEGCCPFKDKQKADTKVG